MHRAFILLSLLTCCSNAFADCTDLGPGKFTSPSGTTLDVFGGVGCNSDGTEYSFGEINGYAGFLLGPDRSTGILPVSDIVFPDLSFSRYVEADGTALYRTSFQSTQVGGLVEMTFRTNDVSSFTLHELVIYAANERDVDAIIYHEHGTQWAFEPSGTVSVVGKAWVDEDLDGYISDIEPDYYLVRLTLYFCGTSGDGFAGFESSDHSGKFAFKGLEPGQYQLGAKLPAGTHATSSLPRAPGGNYIYSNGFSDCMTVDTLRTEINVGLTIGGE